LTNHSSESPRGEFITITLGKIPFEIPNMELASYFPQLDCYVNDYL